MELLIDFMLFCVPASMIQKTHKDIRTVMFGTNMTVRQAFFAFWDICRIIA